MAAADNTLRLLIVEDQVEDAEVVVSDLRNHGMAVRPYRPANMDMLREQLGQQTFDVALLSATSTLLPVQKVIELLQAQGRDLPIVVMVQKFDDEAIRTELSMSVRDVTLRGHAEHIRHVVGREFVDLVTRRAMRTLEARVRETDRRCETLIDSSRDPIAYVHEGMHVRANAAYLEMFGFESFDDIEGMPMLDMIASSHADAFKQLLRSLSKGETPPASLKTEAVDADGKHFPAVMEFAPATYEGEACQQIIFRRQETDPALAQEVEALRRNDLVTGLLNRPTFLQELSEAVGQTARDGTSHGLLLLELDDHNGVLEKFGLNHADDLAAAIAGRIGSRLGPEDIAARFSESVFAVLLRNADHARTENTASSLVEGIRAYPLDVADKAVAATASVGGVQIGERIAQMKNVLGKAHESLQSSAGVGGNRHIVFDPGATDRAEEERTRVWVEYIRDAIMQDKMLFQYQPVIDLMGAQDLLFDTMLHLVGHDGHAVPPGMFVPVAEEHRLAASLDRWSINRAAKDIAEHTAKGKAIRLMIKISQESLDDENLVGDMGIMLQARGVSSSGVVLQLPEAKVFAHLRAAQRLNTELKTTGSAFCIEHFGGGLNSLQMLTHIQPTYLKIDHALVDDLAKSADAIERIREITTRAKELGIRTIARGVQDASTLSQLFSSGVDYVEGGFLAPLSPSIGFDAWASG